MKRDNFMKKRAFTLMELMVVIIILGILAAFVLPSLTGKGEEAKRQIVCIQMKSTAQALKMYKIKHSTYPSTSEGLKIVQFDENKQPKDSWGNEFIYTKTDSLFELVSFGANKEEGGDDDIYYSKCE